MAVLVSLIVPSVERWGILVTNLGAAVVTAFGALWVLFLTSFRCGSDCEWLDVHANEVFFYQRLQVSVANDPFWRGAARLLRRWLFHHS